MPNSSFSMQSFVQALTFRTSFVAIIREPNMAHNER